MQGKMIWFMGICINYKKLVIRHLYINMGFGDIDLFRGSIGELNFILGRGL
jgi:hypothetical protein